MTYKKDLYTYELPEHLIGNAPKDKRDESRLFVYNTQTDEVVFDTFKNVAQYLPSRALMVFNETKVVPARVYLYKETGGKVEVLFLMNLWNDGEGLIDAIVDRKIDVGHNLYSHDKLYTFHIVEQRENVFVLSLNFDVAAFRRFLNDYGETPLPYYIKGVTMREDAIRDRYQTVFGTKPFSIAAPTASLHFTEDVFRSIATKGVEKINVNLHVGLGTFKPVTEENIKSNSLHVERYSVSKEAGKKIRYAQENHVPIIAVGTTSVRTLESYACTGYKDSDVEGETSIFIRPPYQFAAVDHMITNFHLPYDAC
jgi:S-adenosylmethionine:tRNA ribosyltransferase-isomerase